MGRKTFQASTLATLIVATGLTTAAVAGTRREYRFDVGANANVNVETQYGAVSVQPGNSNEVLVTAVLSSDKVEVDRQQNGNRIDIASHLLPGSNQESGQVDYELRIPADATISLHSATGPLSAMHLRGDLTLEGPDAMINVRDVGNGHVHVRTMRGLVTLTDVRNGHVEVESISGDVRMKSVTGQLVQVTTGSGRVSYDGDFGASGDYRFSTHSGDIEALVPADVSADFKAHSMLGRVKHDFPLESNHSRFPSQAGRSFFGTSGKAGSEVVLRSFSGRIRLKHR